MNMYEQLGNLFLITTEIIKCYDLLVVLISDELFDINKFVQIVDKIKKLSIKEYEMYNRIMFGKMNEYIKNISFFTDVNLLYRDERINNKISCVYDRLRMFTVNSMDLFPKLNIDVELSIIDIVNSKILIDTFKMITNKLDSLVCDNDMELVFKEKLIQLNMRNIICKLALKETAELLILDSMFDVQEIPEIDLSVVEMKYFNKVNKKINIKKNIENNIYGLVINLLDNLLVSKVDDKDINSIYSNLFIITHIEILLDFLNLDKLKKISAYYGRLLGNDKLITRNIQILIRKKIKEKSN